MYKVYLKRADERGSVVTDQDSKVVTSSPEEAERAFRSLTARDDLAGEKAVAVLSLNNRQLVYHRFDSQPGMADYIGPDDEIRLFHY